MALDAFASSTAYVFYGFTHASTSYFYAVEKTGSAYAMSPAVSSDAPNSSGT